MMVAVAPRRPIAGLSTFAIILVALVAAELACGVHALSIRSGIGIARSSTVQAPPPVDAGGSG